MGVFLNDVLMYGNGRTYDAANATVLPFPLLLDTPNSVLQLQGLPVNNVFQGDGGRNIGGSHDGIFRHAPISLDLLNGANIVIGQDPHGLDMMMYDDTSLPTIDSGPWYIAASGAGGPDQTPNSSLDPSVAWTGGTFINSEPFSSSFICWVCAYVPQGAEYNSVKNIGFDVGGFLHPSSPDGTIGAFIGDRGAGYGGGVTQTVSGGWKGNRAAHGLAVTTTQYGRVASCFGVNGISNIWGKRMWESQINSNPETATPLILADADTWNGKTHKSFFANIGENAGAGVGVYHMGIYSYPNGITEGEVERVCKFMAKSGRIPYWWI